MQNPKHSLTQEQIQTVVEKLLAPHAEFCYLLGSAATPRFNDESDVDLAVFWKGKDIDFSFKTRLQTNLEDELGREVDLVTLNEIDVIYGFQVLSTGRILFNHNSDRLLRWETQQMSKYPDFKRSRAVIEKNILNRKKYV